MFCNVAEGSLVAEKDPELSIYELPAALHREGLDNIVLSKLGLRNTQSDMKISEDIIGKLKNPKGSL
jgi:CTP synthase